MNEEEQIFVVDTSTLSEEYLSNNINKISGRLIIPRVVLGELEYLSSKGHSNGFIGLQELEKIQKLSKNKNFSLEFLGNNAKSIDFINENKFVIIGIINDLAWELSATLLTANELQEKAAKGFGINVKLIKSDTNSKDLLIDKYFEEGVMSVHIKQDMKVHVKKGSPGNFEYAPINDKMLTKDDVKKMANQIIEKSNVFDDAFVEIERSGSSIVQYFDKRIVITRPAFSDGWEITAVKPLVKLDLDDYKLDPKLMERIEKKADGVLIAGSPGDGKSTFARALANTYKNQKKVVKTVESPRDLDLGVEITQYSKNFGDSEEIHDILLLSRPDYTIFDEVRDTKDFQLYTDLRLSGIGMVGVLHSATPIDAIQRFIGRLELGMIPSVLDTVIFIKRGQVEAVLGLKMTVKVPSGMTDSDLSRPVIEVNNVLTNELLYELYSYGEETVVIPVSQTVKTGVKKVHSFAQKEIEKFLKKNYSRELRGESYVKVVDDNKIKLFVERRNRAKIIGKNGQTITRIEKELGMRIDVLNIDDMNKEPMKETDFDLKPVSENKDSEILFDFKEDKKNMIFIFDKKNKGKVISFYKNEEFLFDSVLNHDCKILITKKTSIGKEISISQNSGILKTFLAT